MAEGSAASPVDESDEHIRGSTVLLAGRMISLIVHLGTKVLIVRWLTKAEFGAFAYGLALVPVIRTVVALGQVQTISRFLSIYEESEEDGKLVGALASVGLVIATLGFGLVLAALALQDSVLTSLVGDATAVLALTILVALGPLEALNRVSDGVLAVLARPSEIFIRRYVVSPAILVVAVVITLIMGGEAVALAWAHVLAGVATAGVSVALAIRGLRLRGILHRARLQGIRLPLREMYGFSTPVLLTELLPIVLGPVAVVILGQVGSTIDVASYRAVFPVARLNANVIGTFTLLYVPLATRFYARRDRESASDAYWHSAAWLLVLSVPAMIATLALAEPVTVLLFGDQYRSSALILFILSLGQFANASTGFNARTLQVHGHVGYLLWTSLATAVASVVAMVALARPFGAVGVAGGVAFGLLLQNVFNHAGLVRLTGIPGVTRDYAKTLIIVVGLLAVMGLWAWRYAPNVWLALGVGGVASLGLLFASSRWLRIADTFPELTRVPGLRRIVA